MGLFKKLFGGDAPQDDGAQDAASGADTGPAARAPGAADGREATADSERQGPGADAHATQRAADASDAPGATEDTSAGASDAPGATEDTSADTSDAPGDTADTPADTSDAAGTSADAGSGTSDAADTSAGTGDAPAPGNAPPQASAQPGAPGAQPGAQPAAPEFVKAGDPALRGQLHIDPARGVAMAGDGSGRQVDPQVYRDTILPALIGKAQDNADLLYQLVVGALAQQANEQALAAATRLKQIDTNAERATAALAASLTQAGRASEAETLVRERLEAEGATGVMLYQLARSLAAQQRLDEAEDALWDSLETDPNSPDSVQWWAMHKQQLDPEGGFRQGLQQADAIDGSWYAALWLARMALEAGDPGGALSFYERALPMSGGRHDALALVSGDLGRLGHPQELLRLIGPLYVARQHGPHTGLNLALAAGQLGDRDRARALLDEVEALGVAAMKPHIDHLRGQLRG